MKGIYGTRMIFKGLFGAHILFCVEHIFISSYTAYVNGQRQGQIMERPFSVGDTIARELSEISSRPFPALDIEGEIKLASDFMEASEVKSVAQKLKELGLER